MGLGAIGVPSLILILVIALIIFGPKKLPEMGSAFGKTLKEFKKSTSELMDDPESDEPKDIKKEDNDVKEVIVTKEDIEDTETKEDDDK